MSKFKATLPGTKPSQVTEYDLEISYAEIEIKHLKAPDPKEKRSIVFYGVCASVMFLFGMILHPFFIAIYQLLPPPMVMAKECPTGCDPPRTKCNKKNGECEGKAKVEPAPLLTIPLPPSSQKDMRYVDDANPLEWRYGAPDANQDSVRP